LGTKGQGVSPLCCLGYKSYFSYIWREKTAKWCEGRWKSSFSVCVLGILVYLPFQSFLPTLPSSPFSLLVSTLLCSLSLVLPFLLFHLFKPNSWSRRRQEESCLCFFSPILNREGLSEHYPSIESHLKVKNNPPQNWFKIRQQIVEIPSTAESDSAFLEVPYFLVFFPGRGL